MVSVQAGCGAAATRNHLSLARSIACCGFNVERTLRDLPLSRSAPGWQDVPAVRSGRVYVTDGSHYFSRPGPRLVDSLEVLATILHPGVHPLLDGLPPPVRVHGAGLGILDGIPSMTP